MTQTPNYRKDILGRGRGTGHNPAGRFENHSAEDDREYLETLYNGGDEDGAPKCQTQTFADTSRTIISTNDSPDVGMEATVNPYRGCEHGCIYCFARPTHEYLGLSAGLDFESKIFVKHDAPKLLEEKLKSRGWTPQIVTLSGVTDCYQPLEKTLKITRGCLEVLRDFKNPAAIITKNHLVMRDGDIFRDMAAWNGIAIHMSVTTLDGHLSRLMEPRASQPALRLKAIRTLADLGVPVSVIIGPVVPGLTDHEIPAILKAAAEAGARGAHYTMLRLPYGVKDLFRTWLEEHYPDRADKIINRILSVREGRLNDPNFGTRMRGSGVFADQVACVFATYRKKYGLNRPFKSLSTTHFDRDARSDQMRLF